MVPCRVVPCLAVRCRAVPCCVVPSLVDKSEYLKWGFSFVTSPIKKKLWPTVWPKKNNRNTLKVCSYSRFDLKIGIFVKNDAEIFRNCSNSCHGDLSREQTSFFLMRGEIRGLIFRPRHHPTPKLLPSQQNVTSKFLARKNGWKIGQKNLAGEIPPENLADKKSGQQLFNHSWGVFAVPRPPAENVHVKMTFFQNNDKQISCSIKNIWQNMFLEVAPRPSAEKVVEKMTIWKE